ncbi:MAG: YidC/Oxa1 family membrane protein insertase [Patescibacteria group bacterium]
MNLWDLFFKEFVYKPQMNFIKFIYDKTGDIGWAMVITAIFFNILAFRWFTKSFLNMQKRLALMQDIKNIQHYFTEKNKIIDKKISDLIGDREKNQEQIGELSTKKAQAFADQQKLMSELNKRFGIVGNYSLKTILLQLWISIGLFAIFNDISRKTEIPDVLYSWLNNGETTARFPEGLKAFNIFKISDSLGNAGMLWMPIVNTLFTLAAMWYTYKYTQRPVVRELTEFEKTQKSAIFKQNEIDGKPNLDQDAIQKQAQIVNMILLPFMTTSFNFAMPTGLNFYYMLLSLLYLIRTLASDWYYRNHQYKYMTDVVEAGPIFPYQEHLEELNDGNFDLKGTPTEIMNYRKN